MTNQCSCQKCHTECNTCKHPEPQHKPTECFTCSKPLYDIITYYDICDPCFGVEINTKNTISQLEVDFLNLWTSSAIIIDGGFSFISSICASPDS